MKEITYFIRWRGEISGPYSIAMLRDMLNDGKITRHHQVAVDQKSWMPIMSVLEAAPAPAGAGKEETAFLKATPSESVDEAQGMPLTHAAVTEKRLGVEEPNRIQEASNKPLRLTKSKRPTTPQSFSAISGSWYYLDGGQVCGPVAFTILQTMAAQGYLTPDTQIIREGDQTWQSMYQVTGIEGAADSYMNQPADENHKPMTPAGFWRRVLALIIDSAVLGCICSVWLLLLYLFLRLCGLEKSETCILLQSFGSVISLLIVWIYFTCLESSSNITTFGKMAVEITVVDEYGQSILYGRANARFWGKFISSFLLIGFIMAAFTQRKQALHDFIANTFVIRVK